MNNKELNTKSNDVVVITDVEVVDEKSSQSDKSEPKESPKSEPESEPEKVDNDPYADEDLPDGKFPGWMDLITSAGIMILSVLLCSLVIGLWAGISGSEEVTPKMTFVGYLVQMLPVIGYVIFLRHKAKRGNAIHLGVRQVNLPMVLWGVLLIIAAGIVIEPILGLFPTEGYDAVKDVIGLGGWAILSTVVAAPILEEVLFRGLIFESCRERFGRGAAVFVSAALFGLIHILPVQVINAFVVGLILGYVYLKTNSLLSVIILHAVNNAIAYATMALLGADANVSLRELVSSSWLYWTIYLLAFALFVYAMVRLLGALRDHTEVAEE